MSPLNSRKSRLHIAVNSSYAFEQKKGWLGKKKGWTRGPALKVKSEACLTERAEGAKADPTKFQTGHSTHRPGSCEG